MTKPFAAMNQSGATRDEDTEDRIHNREADLDNVWEQASDGLFIRLDPIAKPERPDRWPTRHSGPSKEDAS
jgi:hypothetical protein